MRSLVMESKASSASCCCCAMMGKGGKCRSDERGKRVRLRGGGGLRRQGCQYTAVVGDSFSEQPTATASAQGATCEPGRGDSVEGVEECAARAPEEPGDGFVGGASILGFEVRGAAKSLGRSWVWEKGVENPAGDGRSSDGDGSGRGRCEMARMGSTARQRRRAS